MGVYPTSEGKTSPEAIPEALRARRRWMGARLVRRKDGRTDKPPFRVVSGKPIIKCDKTNPDNWATFAEAEAALERGVVDAIGFCIAAEDPLFAVDLDHAVNNDTGEVHPAAAEIVHTLATYCETSISGDGLHLFGEGKKPLYAGCKSNRLGFSAEVYDAARFVVVTGERIGRYAEP